MSGTKLFSPVSIGGLTLRNRIVIAPMCQYSAQDGQMTDWHLIHLGALAHSGAGILTIEATAVSPEGRISYGDVGLYSDECEAAMRRTLDGVRRWSDMPIAIQLGHAGRKASSEVPWKGGRQIAPGQPGGWKTMAPSGIPFHASYDAPMALDRDGLARLRAAFADSAVAPRGSILRRFRSMEPMAISSISFCRRSQINGRMSMAVHWKTA